MGPCNKVILVHLLFQPPVKTNNQCGKPVRYYRMDGSPRRAPSLLHKMGCTRILYSSCIYNSIYSITRSKWAARVFSILRVFIIVFTVLPAHATYGLVIYCTAVNNVCRRWLVCHYPMAGPLSCSAQNSTLYRRPKLVVT